MKFAHLAAAIALCLIASPAFAQNTVDLSPLLGAAAPLVQAVVVALIMLGSGWLFYTLRVKWNIQISDSMRDAFTTFLKNQAQSLVASGAVKLNGAKIEVGSAALAAAANAGIKFVPDALKHFGLADRPDVIAKKIVDMLPQVPAVAAAQGVALDAANPATPSAPPAAPTGG